jgi:hypothetical protein
MTPQQKITPKPAAIYSPETFNTPNRHSDKILHITTIIDDNETQLPLASLSPLKVASRLSLSPSRSPLRERILLNN